MSEQSSTDLLAPWLNDPTILEILVDGYQQFYFEKDGELVEGVSPFRDNDHLLLYVSNLATSTGQKLDANNPMVDMRLGYGARATAVIAPISTVGPVLVIRKFPQRPVSFNDLVAYGSLTPQMVEFLKACVSSQLNIIVAGGTGAGKTTIMNLLATLVPEQERVLLVQEVEEIILRRRRVVQLLAKAATAEGEAITVRELVWQALKMRPDRVIVSELRGNEIIPLLIGMNNGHNGALATMHATSPREVLSRLETMVAVAEPTMPLLTIREQLAWAIDLIVCCQRQADGQRRIATISEVQGLVGENIALQDIFVYRETGRDAEGKLQGRFEFSGYQPQFTKRLGTVGLDLPAKFFEGL